jgi:hypothetical protein
MYNLLVEYVIAGVLDTDSESSVTTLNHAFESIVVYTSRLET